MLQSEANSIGRTPVTAVLDRQQTRKNNGKIISNWRVKAGESLKQKGKADYD